MTVRHSEQEGYDAFNRGVPRTANPYPWSTAHDDCIAWANGYAAARTDLALKKRKATTNGDTK